MDEQTPNPNPIHTYLDLPFEMGISESARPEFDRFRNGGDEELAAQHIAEGHMQHVHRMARHMPKDSTMGVFITDIDGFDLVVVDIMTPELEVKRTVVVMTHIQAAQSETNLFKDLAIITREGGNLPQ